MTITPIQRLYGVTGILVLAAIVEWQTNFIPLRKITTASVPTAVELPTEVPKTAKTEVPAALAPSSGLSTRGVPVRMKIIAWNAQMGLLYANGGPKSTAGSLMETHGVKLSVERYDDTPKAIEDQLKFAEKLAGGDPNPAEGVHFVTIMGDGTAQYLSGINKALSKHGPDFRAEVVGSVGYSRGEDAFMGPEDWHTDPTKMKGALVAGVLRDGDWNIAMYYLQQNGVKNNPDERTYDPEALNWYATSSFVDADNVFINGKCEDRKVVRNGKVTTETHHTCVAGVVTWTPGDVEVAKKKGGIVKLLSTKENAYQMPAVIIGIHKWNTAHAKVVEGLLAAAFEGADQVRNYEAALQLAGRVSAKVYNEETPAYWVRYYKGAKERDAQKNSIELGGSTVSNLGDNLVLFGLADGTGDASSSMFRATYEGFGNIAKQQYPKEVPDFPAVSEAVNLQFLKTLGATQTVKSKPEDATFEEVSGTISDVVAKRDWTINFATGSDTILPESQRTLAEVFNVLAVNKLYVELDGHTDNTGNPAANIGLSERRANAVRTFLTGKAPDLFPTSRVDVKGFGDTKPVATNTTAEGRASNRRVTITIGNK